MAEKPRVAIFYGGVREAEDIKTLKDSSLSPHIVVGTPGRIKAVSAYSLLASWCLQNRFWPLCRLTLSTASLPAG